jgi:hypothetical protein
MPKEMCIEKRPKGKKTAFSLSGTDVTNEYANPAFVFGDSSQEKHAWLHL